jgi:hypothetical protein
MTPENFCYWLKGYFEILEPRQGLENPGHNKGNLTGAQVAVIEKHLNYIFLPEVEIKTLDDYNDSLSYSALGTDGKIC